MKELHSWNVDVQTAIQIQEELQKHIILARDPSEIKTVGGGDVAYSRGNRCFGTIVVLSFPEMELRDAGTASGNTPFPYIPGLLVFREGPILIQAFRKLSVKPDLIIFEGQGIAHPRSCGLASHLGLWFDLPSIGCTKAPLLTTPIIVGRSRGDFQYVLKDGQKVGAILRSKEKIKPIFVSPGHRIDLATSLRYLLDTCKGFRIPEPLRRAHQISCSIRRQSEEA